MKNLKTAFVALLAISIFIISCKDDEEPEKSNQMTIAGVEYELSYGVIENYGIWSSVEAHNFDVTLLSSGFTVHEVNEEIDSISGIGNGISFELFSSDSTDLAVGEYVYDANEEGNAGTFIYAGAVTNYNIETGEGPEYDITGGKVTVNQNGSTYELSIDCTTDDNKTITGYYKGGLTMYDYSDDKKSAMIKNHKW